MDRDSWQQVRELFDAVCELEPSQWRSELSRLSADPKVIAETLELLHAQTRDLGHAREPLERMIAGPLQSELVEGDRLGPWQLCEQLASGGMGVVFRAERADGLYAQEVAIKFLLGKPGPRVAERLAAERRILAGLHHPNIARLYDGGTTPGGQPYLVMEYVQGEPLDAYCVRRRLDLRQRVALFLKVCGAVQAAHARLVLHCDLKPSNILVRADGEPVLLDFGVSRLMEEEDKANRARFFTPTYAAPELQAGQDVGVTSDVFSLGVVLVELLAGKDARRHADEAGRAVSPPSQRASADCAWKRALHGDLDAIVVRAGALPPEQRYASVEALAADVRRWQQHRPVQARGGGRLYRGGRWLRRNWKGSVVLFGVLLLASLFVWRLAQAQAAAEREAKVAAQVSSFLVSMFQAADPRQKGARAGEDIAASEVLDRAASRVDQELAASPEVRARLKGVIGLAYRNTGDLLRAEPLMRQSAEALAAAGGEANIDRAAEQFNLLAGSYANNRNGVEGAKLARRALVLLGEQPADSFRVAQSYNSLGLSELSEQRYDAAEAAFRQALHRHELAGRDQFIGVTSDNLGMLYRRRGNLTASAAAFDRSTPMFQRMFGQMSYEFWTSNTERALLLLDRGDIDPAIDTLQANLARAPKIFGEHSVYFISENNRLALALIRKGEYARAQPYVDTALRLSAQVMGTDSYNYSAMQETAAQLADASGNVEAAEVAYRTALAIREQAIGRDHPDTLDVALQLGMFLVREGNAEGDALVRRAHQQWLPRIPADSANGVRIRQAWAGWLIAQGRLQEATVALDSVRAAAQTGPYSAVEQRILQAELAQCSGDAAAAAASWAKLLEVGEALHGRGSVHMARWKKRVQQMCASGGRSQ